MPDSRTPSKLPERSVSPRVLAGAAFAVYVAGLAVALGRGAIVVIAVTAVVGAVVAAVMRLRRPPIDLPPLGPGAKRAAESVLRSWRRAADAGAAGARSAARRATRALAHGRVRAAAVAADLPKRLPANTTASKHVAQLRTEWRLRQALQLNRAGAASRREGRSRDAAMAHGRALEIYRDLGDRRNEALTLSSVALAEARDDAEAAVASFEAALEILRELGDTRTEGQVLANLGVVHHRAGHDDAAYRCWADALAKLDPASPEHARLAERLQLAS